MAPAETLNAAASHMRGNHGRDHPRHAFWQALAGLLETEAYLFSLGHSPDERVLMVARTYLAGEVS